MLLHHFCLSHDHSLSLIPTTITQVNFWLTSGWCKEHQSQQKDSATHALWPGLTNSYTGLQTQFHWNCTQDLTRHQEKSCPPPHFSGALATVIFNAHKLLIHLAAGCWHKEDGQRGGESRQSGRDGLLNGCIHLKHLMKPHLTCPIATFCPCSQKSCEYVILITPESLVRELNSLDKIGIAH